MKRPYFLLSFTALFLLCLNPASAQQAAQNLAEKPPEKPKEEKKTPPPPSLAKLKQDIAKFMSTAASPSKTK